MRSGPKTLRAGVGLAVGDVVGRVVGMAAARGGGRAVKRIALGGAVGNGFGLAWICGWPGWPTYRASVWVPATNLRGLWTTCAMPTCCHTRP